jgi:L-alanine-DL-glutamate epimerase-like enolase superfamily enzyme
VNVRIQDVVVHPLVRVRRKYPTVISMQVHEDGIHPIEESYFVVFEVITDNGLRGIGEVSDIPEDQIPDLDVLADDLRRVLVGQSPYNVAAILAAFQGPQHENRTLGTRLYDCAVDMALYDLLGRAAQVPVYQLLGGARRREIAISAVVYIRDPALVGEEVKERREQGFRNFKLKVGLGIEQDEASLAALREAAGPEAHVKIDPNGAWDVPEAIRNLHRLARYGVAGVETPIPARDLEGKLAIKREVNVPILEHVSDAQFALECARTRAVDVFNLALCGCGGFYRSQQVAAVAEAAGIGCLLGSTLELWPGTAAQAHFAAALGPLSLPSDLVGPLMYQSDVVQAGWAYRNGVLPVLDSPGLGIELAPDLQSG